MSAASRLLSTIHFMGHTIFPDYPRDLCVADPFLADNRCVCKCVMWRLSETEHSTAYEGTLHIYSYRAIIEMDIQNQLWLFCTYTLALLHLLVMGQVFKCVVSISARGLGPRLGAVTGELPV